MAYFNRHIVLEDGDVHLLRVTANGQYDRHALMLGTYCVATIQRKYGMWWMNRVDGATVYEDLDIALRDMWQLRKA